MALSDGAPRTLTPAWDCLISRVPSHKYCLPQVCINESILNRSWTKKNNRKRVFVVVVEQRSKFLSHWTGEILITAEQNLIYFSIYLMDVGANFSNKCFGSGLHVVSVFIPQRVGLILTWIHRNIPADTSSRHRGASGLGFQREGTRRTNPDRRRYFSVTRSTDHFEVWIWTEADEFVQKIQCVFFVFFRNAQHWTLIDVKSHTCTFTYTLPVNSWLGLVPGVWGVL